MPGIGPSQQIMVSDAFTSSPDTVQRHALGARGMTDDGRVYRYCQAGAVDLVVGNLIQGPATVANHLALVPTAAAAIGATQVTATLGATAATANQYAEGYMQVDTTPGNGWLYQISGHAAVLSGGVITINLMPDDAIQVALTTSSRIGLIANPYAGVIQCPTARTGTIVGVAVAPIPAGKFGWIQTWGPCCVLINGTPTITAPVVNSQTTAGAVDLWTTAAAAVVVTPVGHMMQVGVSTKNNAVFLQIAP